MEANEIKDTILFNIGKHKYLTEELYEVEEFIEKSAREYLKELQKIEGWECMLKGCKWQYNEFPNRFFTWCDVTHSEHAIQFVKGNDEYEVLEIRLDKPLTVQVQERKEFIKSEEDKKAKQKEKRELTELKRLKEKYEYKSTTSDHLEAE